jgi:ABC-type transport system involved in multi-copper enzyme maturation permease subunit
MRSLFTQSLGGYGFGTALTTIGLFGVSLLLVYTFDAFGGLESAREFEELIPESMKALLKTQGGFATDANGYLASGYRHPIYLIAVSAFVIAVSSGVVAKEIERGTILVLLSAPIARWKLLTSKTLAIVVSLLVLMVGAWLGTWVGLMVTGLTGEVSLGLFVRVLFNIMALGLAMGGYTLFISALDNEGGHVAAVAAGITIALFFLDFLATLWIPVAPFGPLSVFHYYDPLAIAQQGGIPWRDVGVLLGVAGVSFLAALVVFQRRDIAR